MEAEKSLGTLTQFQKTWTVTKTTQLRCLITTVPEFQANGLTHPLFFIIITDDIGRERFV
jgi:hypothetical protein